MESNQPRPATEAGFLLNLGLFAAAICLWGPLLLFALLLMSRGNASAYVFAIALFQIAPYACPAGALVVALYAAVVRPWRRPASRAWFFWMQVFAVAAIGFAAGVFALNHWQEQREEAARQVLINHAEEQERLMDAALLADEDAKFASHYQACGEDHCARLSWIRKAVAAQAPRILGLLLRGVTPGSGDANSMGKAEDGSICRDGVRYDAYFSLSNLAGASGDQAVINQLAPLWDDRQLQQAFDGAAMGNQVAAMQMLAMRGANPKAMATPHKLEDGMPVDYAITFAVRTGAADALNWLADHGAQLQDDGEKNGIWVLFDEWMRHTPPSVWNGKIEPILDALDRLGVHPTHNGSEPLWFAIDAQNVRLIHVLMRHGARIEDVNDPTRQASVKSVLAGPDDAIGRDDGRDATLCRGNTLE